MGIIQIDLWNEQLQARSYQLYPCHILPEAGWINLSVELPKTAYTIPPVSNGRCPSFETAEVGTVHS